VNEVPSELQERAESEPPHDDQSHAQTTAFESHHYEPSIASTESSFMPGQAAFSSTPATARAPQTLDSSMSQASDNASWTASTESPLVRLDREIQKFSTEDEDTLGPSTSRPIPSLRLDEPTPNPKQQDRSVQHRSEKSKGKDAAQPLLRNVLRHNLHSISDVSSSESILTNMSPMKYRGRPKTPIPKKYNPYLPPESDPADWNGVVDLRDPSVMTPPRFTRTKPSSRRNPATPAKESDEDESFDGLPPGMSPPVLMSPARPPRSSAELGLLGQTPTREATARITRDLVRDLQLKSGGQARHMHGYANSGIESSMSTMPTPPSLSRYHRQDTTESIAMDSSFESMMRRVGLDVPPSTGAGSTPGLRLRSKAAMEASSHPHPHLQPEPLMGPPDEPMTPVHAHAHLDIDSDSDSFDEVNNTAHPSAAFMMASAQGSHDSDDSFDSSNHSGDSLTEEDANLGLAPVHPFAMGVEDDGFDDSFDDDMYDGNVMGETQEETLFGVPPGQRIHAQTQMRVGGGLLGDGLRMLGEDLLQETIGIGNQIAMSGRVEESPTPASWAGRG
jgi:DASH complex subunit ASK1